MTTQMRYAMLGAALANGEEGDEVALLLLVLLLLHRLLVLTALSLSCRALSRGKRASRSASWRPCRCST